MKNCRIYNAYKLRIFKEMIPDIKNIYFNIDEPFLNKKITKYMMDIYSFYISNQSTKYMNILMVTLEMLNFFYTKNCKNERKND